MNYLIPIDQTEYPEEHASQILEFLYQIYHGRKADRFARATFIPLIKQYGIMGVAFVLHKILESEETNKRTAEILRSLWKSNLGREPTETDIHQFDSYLRYFGSRGQQDLINKYNLAEKKRINASNISRDNPGEAEKLMREVMEDDYIPKSWQMYHEMALSLYRQRKYETAIEFYKTAILLNTDNDNWPWSCDDLKNAFANLDDAQRIEDGIAFFKDVLSKFPNRWPACHQLGWLYWRRVRFSQEKQECYSRAIENYHKAIEMIGDSHDWPWSAIDLINCYKEAVIKDEGYSYFIHLSEQFPKNWGIWHALGQATWKFLENPVEAIEYYKKATEIRPERGWNWSWFHMGSCYKEIKNAQKAQHCFLKALEDNPNFLEAYRELTWGAILLKNWDDALDYIHKGLAIDHNSAVLWLALGDYFRDNPDQNLFFAWLAYKMAHKNNREYVSKVEELAHKYQADLRKLIEEKFSLETDLRTACYDLHIRYENLEGNSLIGKIVSLLLVCEREKRIDDLINWIRKNRADILPDVLAQYE